MIEEGIVKTYSGGKKEPFKKNIDNENDTDSE